MEVNNSQSSNLENGGDNEIRLVMPTEENSKRLYEASKTGSIPNLKVLIQEDEDIIEKVLIFSSNSETPLHISVSHGHLEFTRFLSDQNPALVVEIDDVQRTPLHLASANGDIEIVRVLLEKNTSPCLVRDLNGLIPLHHAVIAEKIEIIKELINARPQSVWTTLKDGQTILHLCVENNSVEAIEYLMGLVIQDQLFLNTIDDNGNSILDLSLMLKRIEIIRYLLQVPEIKVGTNYSFNSTTTNVLRRRHPKTTQILNIKQTENVHGEIQQQQQQQQYDNQLSLSPAINQGCSCWKVLMKHLKYKGDWLGEIQGTLMLVASVIATMSFQGILTPPGGVWQGTYPPPRINFNITEIFYNQGETNVATSIYKTGTAVMASNKHKCYGWYLIVNSFSFFASVSVILLIISGFPLRNKIGAWLLKLAMCVAVAFLSLSYLLGMVMINIPKSYDYGDRDISIYFKTSILWFWALGIVGFFYIFWFLILVVKILIWLCKKILGLFNSKVPIASTTT